MGTGRGDGFDPDWDVMLANAGEGRMINELPILGHILFGISSMYGSMFRRFHRSFITHFPIVSTFIRLVFVGTPVFLLAESWQINLIGNGWHKFWLGFWAGLAEADFIHWYLDKNYGD